MQNLNITDGNVTVEIKNNVGIIEFSHPRGNSLPKLILKEITAAIGDFGNNGNVNVILLRSKGIGAFCAGASFDDLLKINDFESGKDFFMGFARLILAMKECPKFIVTRVQGKAVGGGVGMIAASDYVLAHQSASVRLSELDLGIGPFVVGPVIEKGIGKGAFSALSVDTNWRDADWAETHGLFADVFQTVEELDAEVNKLVLKLSKGSSEAMASLKQVLREGTEDWNTLLEKRAEVSGRLVLSEFTRKFLEQYK